MDVFPRWPLASWQLRVTSALSHPDPAPTQNAGLWPSPSKRTGHFKASSTHGSWDSLREDRAWDRDWLFTQPGRSHPCTALPGKEGRNCQSHGWGSLPVSKQGPWEVACEGFSILLSLAWADACFETRRQKHNKNLPPSLPDLSISFWQTVISFFFPSRIFFFLSLLNWAQANVAKRLFAHVLICQTCHRHALTTILGKSSCLPQLQPKENFPTQLSPSPNTLFQK